MAAGRAEQAGRAAEPPPEDAAEVVEPGPLGVLAGDDEEEEDAELPPAWHPASSAITGMAIIIGFFMFMADEIRVRSLIPPLYL